MSPSFHVSRQRNRGWRCVAQKTHQITTGINVKFSRNIYLLFIIGGTNESPRSGSGTPPQIATVTVKGIFRWASLSHFCLRVRRWSFLQVRSWLPAQLQPSRANAHLLMALTPAKPVQSVADKKSRPRMTGFLSFFFSAKHSNCHQADRTDEDSPPSEGCITALGNEIEQ